MKNYILSIETASQVCSVALHDEGILLANSAYHVPRGHNKVLSKMIDNVLALAGVPCSALAAIAVSYGPGSYTGLRIGISVAKGLAFGLNIPLITVNTLLILAHSTPGLIHKGYIVPMLDARRERAYMMVQDPLQRVVIPTCVKRVGIEMFPWDLIKNHPIYVVGSGADAYQESFVGHRSIHLLNGVYPQARVMGKLAYEKYLKKSWEALAYITPFYGNEG